MVSIILGQGVTHHLLEEGVRGEQGCEMSTSSSCLGTQDTEGKEEWEEFEIKEVGKLVFERLRGRLGLPTGG